MERAVSHCKEQKFTLVCAVESLLSKCQFLVIVSLLEMCTHTTDILYISSTELHTEGFMGGGVGDFFQNLNQTLEVL